MNVPVQSKKKRESWKLALGVARPEKKRLGENEKEKQTHTLTHTHTHWLTHSHTGTHTHTLGAFASTYSTEPSLLKSFQVVWFLFAISQRSEWQKETRQMETNQSPTHALQGEPNKRAGHGEGQGGRRRWGGGEQNGIDNCRPAGTLPFKLEKCSRWKCLQTAPIVTFVQTVWQVKCYSVVSSFRDTKKKGQKFRDRRQSGWMQQRRHGHFPLGESKILFLKSGRQHFGQFFVL